MSDCQRSSSFIDLELSPFVKWRGLKHFIFHRLKTTSITMLMQEAFNALVKILKNDSVTKLGAVFLCAVLFSNTQANICELTMRDFQRLAEIPSQKIFHENAGGIFNKGICWWHTRLQRSSVFLTEYQPEAPKLSLKQAEHVVDELISMNKVVKIRGYKDFNSFTQEHSKMIQRKLEAWQMREGVSKFRGLKGSSKEKPEKMKELMDDLFDRVNTKGRLAFVMLQIPGPSAHSWLVTDMTKTPNGYKLTVTDSSHPIVSFEQDYRIGDTQLSNEHVGGEKFVPYIQFDSELDNILNTIKRHCGRLPPLGKRRDKKLSVAQEIREDDHLSGVKVHK